MPKINVYLPDELAEAVRESKLPVSTICQRALEGALQSAASVREGARTAVGPAGAGRVRTKRLEAAIDGAHEEAADRGHNYVGTEHLLVGLLREGGNLALAVMRALDVDPADVAVEVASVLDGQEPAPGGPARLTPLATRALELAGQESIRLGHDYLGCEHLLLGLVGEEDGSGGRVLRLMGMEATVARRAVITALSGYVHANNGPTREKDRADDAAVGEILTRLARIEERLAAR